MGPADVIAVAGVAAAIGAGSWLAFRFSERAGANERAPEGGELPAGVSDVLAVLEGAVTVVGPDDRAVKTSPALYAWAVVQGDRVVLPALLEEIARTRRDGEIRSFVREVPRGPLSEQTAVLAFRVAPLGPDHVLVLVEDRTEARRLEEVRRDFVANVSHELKTPLGGLSLLSEAMLDAPDDVESVRRFAGRMKVETDRLTRLVQEIIDLSRLQGDDPIEQAEVVRLGEVMREATDRCRVAAEARGIELVVRDADVEVLGKSAQLVTAVRNLVDNAIAYSPEHATVTVEARTVELSDAGGGEVAEVTVTDQGIGIPLEEQKRVFERFYRLDPARSRSTGGTGLGLAIVKHIAARHGGEVTVWSREGQGSSFTLRLPVRRVPSSARPGSPPPSRPGQLSEHA